MDIEVMHRQLAGLMQFKARVQEILDRPAADPASSVSESDLAEIRGEVAKLEPVLLGINTQLGDLQTFRTEITGKLAAVADMLDWFGQNKEGIETLLSIGDEMARKADQSGATRAAAPAEPASGETTQAAPPAGA